MSCLTIAATFLCIVLPLTRRGFDFKSIYGSIAVAALPWTSVPIQFFLDDGDPASMAVPALVYTVVALLFVPFTLPARARETR